MQASERFAYVPGFDSDKEIVYVTPEIDKLLSQYVGEPEDRLTGLRELIEVSRGHWGEQWYFESMPIIFSLYFYGDGFVADLRTSWCSGETVFFPDDVTKEKESLSEWIE